MLKTRVTLGNISRVLLSLTKDSFNICNVQRLLPPLNVHAVNIRIFSSITVASHLNFCSLAYLLG